MKQLKRDLETATLIWSENIQRAHASLQISLNEKNYSYMKQLITDIERYNIEIAQAELVLKYLQK